MPGVREADYYPWPYVEALRMDEAMNELAHVRQRGSTGSPCSSSTAPPSASPSRGNTATRTRKPIVKIELRSKEPRTFWQIQKHEYGFISNVNPYIPHPRWSQATSHWLDNREPFPTPIYNGYESYVGEFYPDEPRELQKPLKPGQIAR